MGIEAGLDLLACPRWGSGRDLVAAGAGRALACASGHSFDVARQGYVNLLGGPEPGNADTPAMLAARERVHASGLFEPVAAEVAAQLVGRPRVPAVGAGTAYHPARAIGGADNRPANPRLPPKPDVMVARRHPSPWRLSPPRVHDPGLSPIFRPQPIPF